MRAPVVTIIGSIIWSALIRSCSPCSFCPSCDSTEMKNVRKLSLHDVQRDTFQAMNAETNTELYRKLGVGQKWGKHQTQLPRQIRIQMEDQSKIKNDGRACWDSS